MILPTIILPKLPAQKIRQNHFDVLMNLNVPVMFIAGKQDPKIPLKEILTQAVLPAHSQVVILDKVGHMGFIKAPKETLQAIRSFMKC